MSAILEVMSWVSLLVGGLLVITGGIGVLRFPDLYTRMHAASVTDTGGAGLVLFGLMLQAGLTLVTVKLVLILWFLLFTSPVSSHVLAKAALHGKLEPQVDDEEEGAPLPHSSTS
ncbi:MAG: monovalent cation/H(+) antiporter subunit G [Gammaproteobacteria bacterium]|nr:monovalent cation/H(+) antiporter subunit G [Gammaproteobacteria bacterium]MDX2462200.1 monovalent cation/H(+) antiporter subunit G [Gammaproteobacteria bacterium]